VPDDERRDVQAVVGVQVGEEDRVDARRVGVALQGAEGPVAEVEDQPETVVLDEVAGGR
jgi:hypothetical protein